MHGTRWIRAALAWTVVLSSAASRAETGWREIRAPHVVLRTDLGSSAAREAARVVELYRAELIAAAWPRATFPPGDVIEMTVFANGLDFERYFGRNVGGIFFHHVPPHAVMYGSADRWEKRATLATPETTSILKHEYAHHLAASIFRRQPRWFAEGLAQFLETVRLGENGKSVILGGVNLEALAKYKSIRSLRIADALRWSGTLDTRDEMTVHGLYGLSWMMVHWLFNEHPDQFSQLQSLLAKGIDSEKAWRIIRPALGADEDEALQLYAKHGNYQEFEAPMVQPTTGAFTEEPLGEADVHATLARVALSAAQAVKDGKELRAEGEKEIAAALRVDPKNLQAGLLQIRLAAPDRRVPLARQLVVAHPEDGRAWSTLADALGSGGGEERDAATRKAVALLPEDPRVLNSYAWMLVQQGKAGEAAAPAIKAVALAPSEPSFLDTLAVVQARLGRCSEARSTQARAIDALPDQVSPQVLERYRKRLTDLETSCVSAAPPPATPPSVPGRAAPTGSPPHGT